MNRKITLFLMTAFLALNLTGQTDTLYVNLTSHYSSSYDLDEVGNLTFTETEVNVAATDGSINTIAIGNIESFTFGRKYADEPQNEVPNCATLTNPANALTNVAINATLMWDVSANATSYDVYLDTGANPDFVTNTIATSYSTTLVYRTTYYWKIIAKNSAGDAVNCETRNFTTISNTSTIPNCASLIAPANGGTNVPINAILSWDTAVNATSYDVYFGTGANPAFVTNTTDTSYTPTLAYATTYYWKIIAKNVDGEATGCETRNFTTIANTSTIPNCASLIAPANGGTNVAINATLSWDIAANATSYDVYFGTGANPAFVTNTTVTSYSPTLVHATTYYWKIIAKNAVGEATNCGTRSFTTVPSVGLTEIESKTTRIFPNPVTDLLTVESETTISEITIFDLTGREVLHDMTHRQGAIVSFQSCPAGVYFIQITTEKDTLVKKIIKY